MALLGESRRKGKLAAQGYVMLVPMLKSASCGTWRRIRPLHLADASGDSSPAEPDAISSLRCWSRWETGTGQPDARRFDCHGTRSQKECAGAESARDVRACSPRLFANSTQRAVHARIRSRCSMRGTDRIHARACYLCTDNNGATEMRCDRTQINRSTATGY